MDWEEKVKAFESKNAREAFKTKTSFEELPLRFAHDSSIAHPEMDVDMKTADLVLWVKFLDKWFRPYGSFNQEQITKMVNVCSNDNQILALMELLSASK
jgi:hypothetical protein